MKKNERLLHAIGKISDELVFAAAPKEKTARRSFSVKKAFALAAAILLAFALSVPALAAADYEPAYKLLYSLSPAIAQGLKPVRMVSEDQGIVVEVVSALVEGSEAKVYLSVRDLVGGRIDETADLFDSYDINAPFGCSGYCENVGFDPQTKAATFLVSISRYDESGADRDIADDKITFRLRQLLGKKQTFNAPLPELMLDGLSPDAQTYRPAMVFGGGGEGLEETADRFRALKPAGDPYSPVKGADITAMGFVDGKLHVQLQFANVLETDNHGYLYFKNSRGEEIHSEASYSFAADKERKARFEEHVYGLSEADLKTLTPHGYFVTSDSLIKGSWSVTFPLKSVR